MVTEWTIGGLFLIALAASAMGFWRTLYFISIGYGASIAALAVAGFVLADSRLSIAIFVQLILLFIYGVRLAIYIACRERSSAYRARPAHDRPTKTRQAIGVQSAIWVSVSALYVAMASPGIFHSIQAARGMAPLSGVILWSGLTFMGFGFAVEAIADQQKSAFKKRSPDRFCEVGLYRVVRSPNYLGEILFWLGNAIAAVPFYDAVWNWLLAITGLLCIVMIMLGATRRLELSQKKRYGGDPVFDEYIRRVPVLFPFVPVFSLIRWPLRLG